MKRLFGVKLYRYTNHEIVLHHQVFDDSNKPVLYFSKISIYGWCASTVPFKKLFFSLYVIMKSCICTSSVSKQTSLCSVDLLVSIRILYYVARLESILPKLQVSGEYVYPWLHYRSCLEFNYTYTIDKLSGSILRSKINIKLLIHLGSKTLSLRDNQQKPKNNYDLNSLDFMGLSVH
jgi:hypothetical protein